MNELNISNVLSVSVEFTTIDGIQITGLSNINESLSTHYIIYKIHNIENGKHYIGQHATDDPFDTYMGSGKLIQRSLDKRPISSFVKEILFDFETFEQMDQKEQELVPLSSCYPNDPMSYNLREGGMQGKLSNETKHKIGQISSIKNSGAHNPMYGKSVKDYMTPEKYILWRQHIANGARKNALRVEWHEKMSEVTRGKNNGMFGKKLKDCMSSEQYAQWREKCKDRNLSGKNNGMFGQNIKDHMSEEAYQKCLNKRRISMSGRIWVTDGIKNRLIYPNDLDQFLYQGYKRGFTLKHK